MPYNMYSAGNNKRKLEDIADSLDLVTSVWHACADTAYKTTNGKQTRSCNEAVGVVVRDGKEVWLCRKHFEKACDFLQEDLRKSVSLKPFYDARELVVYE